MLMIRFQRIGRTNDPAFRIVLVEKARAAKTGNVTEQLGTYNPKSKALTLNEARVKEWIAKGAQPTGSLLNLLIGKGVIRGKKVNVLPKKTPLKPIASEAIGSGEQPAAILSGSDALGEQVVIAAENEIPIEVPTEAEASTE